MIDKHDRGEWFSREMSNNFMLPPEKDRKKHASGRLGIIVMLLLLLLPAGSAPASEPVPPPDPNIPVAQEISPALGLWRNTPPVITLSTNGMVMVCGQMRFTGETFIFENFDYIKPMIISAGGMDDPIAMSFVPGRQELLMESQPAFASHCLQLWDTQTWQRISKLKDFANIMCLPDGKGIVAVQGHNLVLLNVDDKSPVWSITLPDKAKLTAMAVSPDSGKIAIAYRQIVLEVSARDGRELSSSETLAANCLSYSVDRLQYTSDSAGLLAGITMLLQKDKAFKSGKRANRLLSLESGKLSAVQDLDDSGLFSLSPDGDMLASLRSGLVMVFSFPGLKPLLRIPVSGILLGLVWAPDGKSLLTIGNTAVCSQNLEIVHYPPSGLASIGSLFSKKKGRSNVFVESVNTPKCPYFVRKWHIIQDNVVFAPGDYAAFDQDAAPGEPRADSAVPSVPVETCDGYLEQGDREAEAGNTRAALEHYQKALALAPGNLVAGEKCNEMKKVIAAGKGNERFRDYLKKASANYDRGNIKLAFLYLAESLRAFPEGSAEAQGLLTMMARKYPGEIEAILTEKSKELRDVCELIDTMLRNAGEKNPAAAGTGPQEVQYKEPYLQRIKSSTDTIRQNKKGFWEAVFPNNITMVYIPEGEFTMGSPAREGDADEHPAHKVFISGYWIGKTEVTFAQFDAYCLDTGLARPEDEGWGRDERPVIYVSWKEAQNFCAWLEKKTGLPFRLPTEAEWEKAARDRFPWGNTPPASHLANFNKELMKTSTAGSYPQGASPYGVLDMAGNVWEWLADWYDAGDYKNSADSDPRGMDAGSERVVRGGSWANKAALIRSANRSQENPDSKLNILGFRLALAGH